jgi:PAS domain S-box-containing protein
LVLLIGAATAVEYLFAVDLRIDQLFFADPLGSHGTSAPGRLAPMTALGFVVLGLALLLLDTETRRGHRPAQPLSLVAGLIAMMAICGYIYHAMALDKILLYTQVAMHTAAALFLLSIAVFFARPEAGIAGDLTSEGSGAVMARRFLPAVFFVPPFLGWIRLQGQIAGWYGTEIGLVIFATSNVVVFAVLVWLSARQMNKEYGQRSRAERDLREFNIELEARVAQRTAVLERQAVVLTEQAALLDLAHDSIFVRDTNNRIAFWNKGAALKYGWTAEQAIGRVAHELLSTVFPVPLEQIQSQLLAQGHWDGELIHTCANRSRITVASRWALQCDLLGQPRVTLEINNDVTERKLSEVCLAKTLEDLKRSNGELQQFAYVASHDLQEPLRMVASFTELLAKRYHGQLDADADEFISYAVDGCNRMQALIQDLLAYSRAGAETRELHEISSEGALRAALDSLAGAVRENAAVVTHDPLPLLTADHSQLSQVFQNLISNAIKYRGSEPPCVHVSASKNGHRRWTFSVRDNGIGIDPQYFERIFVIFQRLHGRDKFKGTGIGLAICKKIVERMGGNIWVESEPQKGSTFYFALPESDGK